MITFRQFFYLTFFQVFNVVVALLYSGHIGVFYRIVNYRAMNGLLFAISIHGKNIFKSDFVHVYIFGGPLAIIAI